MLTLWLIPDEVALEKLQNITVDLGSRLKAPVFQPHVTLLSGIIDTNESAINKAEFFAKNTPKIEASITNVEYLEEQFKCLFFTNSHSESLIKARQKSEELFEHTNIQPFIPHVSFLYGAMPIFQSELVIDAFEHDFLMPLTFSTLRLVRTQRTPETWQQIAEFPFQQ